MSKTKKLTEEKASEAAAYLNLLDQKLCPAKPISWTLIRPPWASSMKSVCLKKAIFNKLNAAWVSLLVIPMNV